MQAKLSTMNNGCESEVQENLGGFVGTLTGNNPKIGIDVLSGNVYVRGPNNQWIKLATSSSGSGSGGTSTATTSTIGITLDGGGLPLTTGQKGYVRIPYNATITEWAIISKEVGSLQFDVWKLNAAKPTIANSITGSAKPILSNIDFASSNTLTGWNTNVISGDIIGWNVDSVATITWAVLELTITKT